MARGATVQVDINVTGYWQACPVCGGCGSVPADFYERHGMGTSCARLTCRRCVGTGTVTTPAIHRPTHVEAMALAEAFGGDVSNEEAATALDVLSDQGWRLIPTKTQERTP